MSDRKRHGIVAPDARVNQNSARRIGMVDVAEQRDRVTTVERRDAPRQVPRAQIVNFWATLQGSDYVPTSATVESPPTLIPGSICALSTSGVGIWLFDLSCTALILSASAATVDVVFYPVVDFGFGSWLAPDMDAANDTVFPRAGLTLDFQNVVRAADRHFVHARASFIVDAGVNARIALFLKPTTGNVTIDTSADARYRPRISGHGLLCQPL